MLEQIQEPETQAENDKVVPDVSYGYSQSATIVESIWDQNKKLEISYYATLCLVDLVNEKAYPILSFERPNLNSAKEVIGLDEFKTGFRTVLEYTKTIRKKLTELIKARFPEQDKWQEIEREEYDRRFQDLVQEAKVVAAKEMDNIVEKTSALDNFGLVNMPFQLSFDMKEMGGLSYMLKRDDKIKARNQTAALRDANGSNGKFKIIKPKNP
tara:strand:+ start:171 stop:806 length:636 start_codon:yes stop_codon:yes gene_type:complete